MNKGGKGGDVVFIPGRGAKPHLDILAGEHGSFVFKNPDGASELMRIDSDGTVTVRGNVVATDFAVYEGLVAWLASCNITGADGLPVPNPIRVSE